MNKTLSLDRSFQATHFSKNHQTNKKYIFEYFSILGLMFLSGSPVAGVARKPLLFIALFALIILCLYHKKKLNIEKVGIILYFYCMIFFIQYMQFDFFAPAYISFCMIVTIAYLTVAYIEDFVKLYIKTMCLLSILSLLFIIPVWLFGYIPDFLITISDMLPVENTPGRRWTILLHTYAYTENLGVIRNVGIFGEPGNFACYLNIALFFLGISKNKFKIKTFKTYAVILVTTIISTMSTQGYLILPFSLFYIFPAAKTLRGKYLKPIVILLLLPICFLLFTQAPFLKNKISIELNAAEYKKTGWEITRTGELLLARQYIKKKPFVGWGLHDKTRYQLTPFINPSHMSNGFAHFICQVGLIGFSIAFFSILHSYYHHTLSIKKSVVYALFLLFLFQGMVVFNFPMIYCLMFLKPKLSAKNSLFLKSMKI